MPSGLHKSAIKVPASARSSHAKQFVKAREKHLGEAGSALVLTASSQELQIRSACV